MQLTNSASIPVTATVTNSTTGSQNFNEQLQPGDIKQVPVSEDFTYRVTAKAIGQSPANKDNTIANAKVLLSIVNGALTVALS